MRKFCLSLLFLTFVTATLTGVLPTQLYGQYGEDACIITLKGQNRYRKVAGAVNTECGFIPVIQHSPPFGNWGVKSNYDDIKDAEQFRGWKWQTSRLLKDSYQWNSCTTRKAEFRAPNREYYNVNNSTAQASPPIVTHGTMHYRTTNVRTCPPPWWNVPLPSRVGCEGQEGSLTQASNYMRLYELDFDDRAFIETLYFPGTSVTLTNCTENGCPEKTTGWVKMTRSSSSTVHAEAELRMTAIAQQQGGCDWSWTE